MAYVQIETQPMCEPVALADMKNFCRVEASMTEDDSLISVLITGARQYCERFTRRYFINTGLVQCLDSFPYYTDTVASQQAYPPAYYSLPRYSTTLWNYSQMIKLFYSRLAKVTSIIYIGTDGEPHTLNPEAASDTFTADFVFDPLSEPPRLFPNPGEYWPPCLYAPNAVEIHYICGYNNEAAIAAALTAFGNTSPAPNSAAMSAQEALLRQADVPSALKISIMMLVAHWYENREAVVAQALTKAPQGVEMLLWNYRVLDMAPTRG
jgi:hypothetical protein